MEGNSRESFCCAIYEGCSYTFASLMEMFMGAINLDTSDLNGPWGIIVLSVIRCVSAPCSSAL